MGGCTSGKRPNNEPYAQPVISKVPELEQKFKLVIPQYKCSKGNPIAFLCSSPTCISNALFCSTPQCESCFKNHEGCPRSEFRQVTNQLQIRYNETKKFLYKMFEVENNIFEEIKKRRSDYIEKAYTSGLEKEHLDLIQLLYQSKNEERLATLTGRTTFNIEDKLKRSNDFFKRSMIDDPHKTFQKEVKEISLKLQEYEKKLMRKLEEQPEVKYLQIRQYGYYDITSKMQQLRTEQKKKISHLTIVNTVKIMKLSVTVIQYRRNHINIQRILQTMQLQELDYLEQQVAFYSVYDSHYAAVIEAILRSQSNKQSAYIQFYHSESNYEVIKGIFQKIKDKLQPIYLLQEPFVKELSKFTGLSSLSLHVAHSFEGWDSFDQLPDRINKKMNRLQTLNIHVPENAKNPNKEVEIRWTEKLRGGIKVNIKPYNKKSDITSVIRSQSNA